MSKPSCRVCVPRRLSQLQASAESLLELPDALFTGALTGRPLACQEARRRLDATAAAIEQLRQAVDRAEWPADRHAWELDPRTFESSDDSHAAATE